MPVLVKVLDESAVPAVGADARTANQAAPLVELSEISTHRDHQDSL